MLNEANVNEAANLKEKLLEEERKNMQMQQCIQQMKQQHAQLMAQLGNTNNESFNPEANSTDDRSNLLIETGRKGESSRMKQLEVQVQQMQEEMNKAAAVAAASAMHHTVEMSSSNIQSAQVSPHLANSHLPASSSSNLNTQYELLKANERFLKEKVRF